MYNEFMFSNGVTGELFDLYESGVIEEWLRWEEEAPISWDIQDATVQVEELATWLKEKLSKYLFGALEPIDFGQDCLFALILDTFLDLIQFKEIAEVLIFSDVMDEFGIEELGGKREQGRELYDAEKSKFDTWAWEEDENVH